MNVLAKTPAAYRKLVGDISRLYKNARKALAEFYWYTGQRIVKVEQDGVVRARYGDNLLKHLSRDLSENLGPGFSERNLERMRNLYLKNPISPTSAKLPWSQEVELLSIEDLKTRTRLEKKAIREDLTSRELRALVQHENLQKKLSKQNGRALLRPIKGKIGVYRIVEFEGKLQWDKGFAAYRELLPVQARSFKEGDFVRHSGGAGLEKIPDGKVSDLYTYEAGLIRSIDADTFWMRVWTARPEWRMEKLRLRGIDAPELNTKEGKAAKRFVDRLFKKAKAITVTTTKPDKYHRYLTDVYLAIAGGEEIFINNVLLEKGHAVRTDKIPLTEWEKE